MGNNRVIIGRSSSGELVKIAESSHKNINKKNNVVKLTKKQMILELTKEFRKKQGNKKAKWVYNKLIKIKKDDVKESYIRLKDNIYRG